MHDTSAAPSRFCYLLEMLCGVEGGGSQWWSLLLSTEPLVGIHHGDGCWALQGWKLGTVPVIVGRIIYADRRGGCLFLVPLGTRSENQ